MAREPRTWDHAIIRLTDEEARRLAVLAYTCGIAKCKRSPTHIVSYRYVTGRGGRVTTTRRYRCTEHAQRFASKWELDMPTEASERPRTAVDHAVDALLSAPRCLLCDSGRAHVSAPARDGYYVRPFDSGGFAVVKYGLPPFHDQVLAEGLREHEARWALARLVAGNAMPSHADMAREYAASIHGRQVPA